MPSSLQEPSIFYYSSLHGWKLLWARWNHPPPLKWAWVLQGDIGLFLGLTSEPMLHLPPTRLGTADEKCPLSEAKMKRKQCCCCRLHFSLLLAMRQTDCFSICTWNAPISPDSLETLFLNLSFDRYIVWLDLINKTFWSCCSGLRLNSFCST